MLVAHGSSDLIYTSIRNQADEFIKKGKYGEAIDKLRIIIESKNATAVDYNSIGNCYLTTKKYGKAIKFLKEGERLDNTELLIKLNLAHAYLLNDNYSQAKSIYKKYQSQNVTDNLSWSQKIKLDFENFKKLGISNEDFPRVLKLVE